MTFLKINNLADTKKNRPEKSGLFTVELLSLFQAINTI